MNKVFVVCVGGLKEDFFKRAQEEYQKRLKKFCNLSIVELDEQKLPSSPSEAQIAQALEREAQSILPKLRGKVFVLAIEGEQTSSVEFSRKICSCVDAGEEMTFVVGGSLGLSKKIKDAGKNLSFSKMTFPHHLARVMLLEQIYRAFSIKSGSAYHK